MQKSENPARKTGERNDGVNAVLVRDSVDLNVLEALVDWGFDVDSDENVTEEMLMMCGHPVRGRCCGSKRGNNASSLR